MTKNHEVTAEQLDAINRLIENLPEDYGESCAQLENIFAAVRDRIAKVLEPKMTEFFVSKAAVASTVWQHRELAEHIDSTTKNLGLCVSHEGRPALISYTGSSAQRVRHQGYMLLTQNRSRDIQKSPVLEDLSNLKLMPSPNNVEVLFEQLREYAAGKTRNIR